MWKLLLFLIPFTSFAQKDFDYTIYTTHISMGDIDSSKYGTVYFATRKIQKDANVIKIISLVNTGDTKTFVVEYGGWDIQSRSFIYSFEEGTIIINPITPTLIIRYKNGLGKVLYD